jgi:pyruvate dehydrogenase E1 component alpha subunit
MADNPIRYLSETGEPLSELPLSHEELLKGYRALARARWFDEHAMLLQRQGRLGVYPPFRGQEAAQVGAALALEASDWVVPSYRETGVLLSRIPMSQILLFWRAHPRGWHFKPELRTLPPYVPIATQLPQAVGLALASRHLEPWAVLSFIGDGGSSEGDFHEALNMAGVFQVPLVVILQNNGWAISVPTSRQTRAKRLSERAKGYGIRGLSIDGNDLVAVWVETRKALEAARAGEGPTLLEAITYRVAPHTSSDDPGRYRSEEEVAPWLQRDPLLRMKKLLEHLGLWSEEEEAKLQHELAEEFDAAVAEADRADLPQPWEIVEHVFARMTPAQQAAWEALHG